MTDLNSPDIAAAYEAFLEKGKLAYETQQKFFQMTGGDDFWDAGRDKRWDYLLNVTLEKDRAPDSIQEYYTIVRGQDKAIATGWRESFQQSTPVAICSYYNKERSILTMPQLFISMIEDRPAEDVYSEVRKRNATLYLTNQLIKQTSANGKNDPMDQLLKDFRTQSRQMWRAYDGLVALAKPVLMPTPMA